MPSRQPGRRSRAPILLVLAVLLIAALTGHKLSRSAQGRREAPFRPRPAHRHASAGPQPARSIEIDATVEEGQGKRLPRSFLGLSTEYWDLPALDGDPRLLRRVLALVHVAGEGPVVLRIGGDSAAQTYWGTPPPGALRAWPYEVSRRWFERLARSIHSDRFLVMLDLNLAAESPAQAAGFARAAMRYLHRGSIAGFEIGNEPDIYHNQIDYHLPWPRARRRAHPPSFDHFWPAPYDRLFRRYAIALQAAAPGVPLAGPALSRPREHLSYIRDLLASDRQYVGLLSVHRYPLSACARPQLRYYSTIARVLEPSTAQGLANGVAPAVQLARRAGLTLRVTELNSVTCEGRRGVSNTFATALWAPDALFTLWQAGVAGVNIHVRQGAVNGAFQFSRRGLEPRPLLYGLALFARSLGPRASLLSVRAQPSTPAGRLWAIRTPHALKVLVLDKGALPLELRLRAPVHERGTVERLLAPSVRATAGVTLAGQQLTEGGRWAGRLRRETIAPGAGGRYLLAVPGYSAALLTFELR